MSLNLAVKTDNLLSLAWTDTYGEIAAKVQLVREVFEMRSRQRSRRQPIPIAEGSTTTASSSGVSSFELLRIHQPHEQRKNPPRHYILCRRQLRSTPHAVVQRKRPCQIPKIRQHSTHTHTHHS